jgi:hypothetical protein
MYARYLSTLFMDLEATEYVPGGISEDSIIYLYRAAGKNGGLNVRDILLMKCLGVQD